MSLAQVVSKTWFGTVTSAAAVICAFWYSLLVCFEVRAGGSAETTLLVVNARSPLSQHIANEYRQLRDVPDTHVVYLNNIPFLRGLSIEGFRRRIWQPIRDYLLEHDLEEEIDLIVYSSGFPYGVNFGSDIKAKSLPRNRYRGNMASLTGLTYFARRVEAGDVGYLSTNHYFREFAGQNTWSSRSAGTAKPLEKKEVDRLRKAAGRALQRKAYPAAIEHYRQLLDSYPAEPEYWYGLARAHAAAGQLETALETLSEAVDLGWTHSLQAKRAKELTVLRENPAFQDLVSRMENAFGPFEISHGFRHRYVWSNSDLAFWEADDVLDQYYLSTMLAYTGARGNSLPEIRRYLSRAATSDGTAPDGTVYLMENSNVRSETRQPLFPATVTELTRRGRRAAILARRRDRQNGIIPVDKDDVIGAVVGSAGYHWDKSGSRLLAGAIAESLTSYGGHFNHAGQTKLTEFLSHGAAGSSGAVAEPYSFQEKFPVPLLHVYYADGCSLVEAFYQSILAPYQLIIVGDPLARPFASFAEVSLKSPDVRDPWAGVVEIIPAARPANGKSIKAVELWIDGDFIAQAPLGEAITWDSRHVEDGGHELRLVAVEDSAIETRSTFRAAIEVANRDLHVELGQFMPEVAYEQRLDVTGNAADAERIELRRGHQILDTTLVEDGRWQISVPAEALGSGTASLWLRGLFPDGYAARSESFTVSVRDPRLQRPTTGEKPVQPGLDAVVYDAQGKSHQLSVKRLNGRLKGLLKDGLKPKRIALSGFMQVEESGFYELVVQGEGHVKLVLHEQVLFDDHLKPPDAEVFLALGLDTGWHRLFIELEPGNRKPFLKLLRAGAGEPVYLGEQNLRH